MSDLKPCPFCGGEAKTEQVERIHYGTVYRVGCHTDGCKGWWYESVLYRTEAKAIEAWNTRTPEQAIAATLGSGECRVVASSTDGLCTDNPRHWYELSCGHSFTVYGLEMPVACPICAKAVKR